MGSRCNAAYSVRGSKYKRVCDPGRFVIGMYYSSPADGHDQTCVHGKARARTNRGSELLPVIEALLVFGIVERQPSG